jgi:hypothetical protein
MAHAFSYFDATNNDALKVWDMSPSSLATMDPETAGLLRGQGTSTPQHSAPRSAKKREAALRALDQYYGPLVFASFTITRVELHLMNARVRGAPLDAHNTNFRRPSQPFIDELRLNPADVENRLRASGTVGDYTLPTLLFEIATLRSVTAAPLFDETTAPPHAQKLDVIREG